MYMWMVMKGLYVCSVSSCRSHTMWRIKRVTLNCIRRTFVSRINMCTGKGIPFLQLPPEASSIDHSNTGINRVKRCESRGVPIIHHIGYVSDLPPHHRFAMRKFHGVMKFLRKDNVVSMKQVFQPYPVSESTTGLVHTVEYIKKFFNGKTSAEEQRQTGFKWSQGLVSRCRLESGGTVLGSRMALQHGLACSTGGGTHHAFPSHGSGFCLINDLAIAARYVIYRGLATKVLIVDLDVHQGNGTAFIFKDDDQVFTFSMHCGSNFPLHKQQSDLDVPLPNGTADEEYLSILASYLPPILDTFRPDLVLYDAGVDPHERDELGRLNLSDTGLYRRDYYVLDTVVSRGIPCLTVIGGGYDRDLQALSIRHTIVHRAATKIWWEKGL